MMMATWRGAGRGRSACAAGSGSRQLRPVGIDCQSQRLDLHDLLFLVAQRVVDLLDVIVGRLLHLGAVLLVLVLADGVLFFELLQMLHRVAAHVAHGDALLLGVLAGDLGEFGAPFAGERRNRNAQLLAVDDRVEAQIGGADRFVDGAHHGLVPHLTEIMRGSGTVTVATWLSGDAAP